MKRLPPLNALRIFECAARHNSFTRAAEELGLTQSAVSKQVALLETHLGKTLFKRLHRSLELTPSGQLIARATRLSLEQLAKQLDSLEQQRPQQLHVLADADFSQLWLFPRLPDFEARYPHIRLALQCETTVSDQTVNNARYDCALLWGRGEWRNCRFEPLFTNTVFPVARADYFAHLQRPPLISDLESRMLIHDRSPQWWRTIFAAEGAAEPDPELGYLYSQTSLCLEAAARGDGITVGDEVTTRAYLESGQLVTLFDIRIPSPDAYYLLFPKQDTSHEMDEKVQVFTRWLRGQGSEHRQWLAHFWSRHST